MTRSTRNCKFYAEVTQVKTATSLTPLVNQVGQSRTVWVSLAYSQNVRLLAIVMFCFVHAPVFAQIGVATGTIQGSIVDPSGSAIPSASVDAENSNTRVRRTTRTDRSGNFVLSGVGIGFWRLTAEVAGFSPAETDVFQVSVGQVVVRRLQLQPAGVVEKVEVKENPEAIETQASTASVALGYERIEEAPARSRNYLNFVLAAPGVAPSAGAASQRTMTGVRSPVPDTGFTFGGCELGTTAFRSTEWTIATRQPEAIASRSGSRWCRSFEFPPLR